MDAQLANTLATGTITAITTFGSIWLKDYLDRRPKSRPRKMPRSRPAPSDRKPAFSGDGNPVPPGTPPRAPAPAAAATMPDAGAPVASVGTSHSALETIVLAIVATLLGAAVPWSGMNLHAPGSGTKWAAVLFGVVIIALDLGLLVRHRNRATSIAFQFDNAVLWTAVTFGATLFDHRYAPTEAKSIVEAVLTSLVCVGLSAAIGAALLYLLRKKPD